MRTMTRQMPCGMLPAIMIGMTSVIPLLVVIQLFLAGLAIVDMSGFLCLAPSGL